MFVLLYYLSASFTEPVGGVSDLAKTVASQPSNKSITTNKIYDLNFCKNCANTTEPNENKNKINVYAHKGNVE